jgi:predicted ATPase
MLNNITLVNFKSFVNTSLELKPLTVLTGLNNSGKSSVIQAINMIHNYYDIGNLRGSDEIHVSPRFLKSKLSKENYFHLSLETDTNLNYTLKIKTDGESFLFETINKNNPSIEIQYISADRFGPRNILKLNPEYLYPEIGINGEYIVDYIDKNTSMQINPILARSDILLLKENINAWLQYISPGTEFSYEIKREQNSSYPYYNKIHPTETGYGLSYTLPIITALLISGKTNEPILLIENPEAHLHPKGQTAIGELIALAASAGKQIIVETHSDHLLDGIRIAVKQKKISATEVIFHYFSRESSEGESKIETPVLGEDGKLSFWPKGFFDQSMINKAELLKNG